MLSSANSSMLNEKANEMMNAIVNDNLFCSKGTFEDDLNTYDLLKENGFEDFDDFILKKVIARNVDLTDSVDIYSKLDRQDLRDLIIRDVDSREIRIDEIEFFSALDAWNWMEQDILDDNYVGDIIHKVKGVEMGNKYDRDFFNSKLNLEDLTSNMNWANLSSIANQYIEFNHIDKVIDENNCRHSIINDYLSPDLLSKFYDERKSNNESLIKFTILANQDVTERNIDFYDEKSQEFSRSDWRIYIGENYSSEGGIDKANEIFEMSNSRDLKEKMAQIITDDYKRTIHTYKDYQKYAEYLSPEKAQEINDYIINKDPAGTILNLFEVE